MTRENGTVKVTKENHIASCSCCGVRNYVSSFTPDEKEIGDVYGICVSNYLKQGMIVKLCGQCLNTLVNLIVIELSQER